MFFRHVFGYHSSAMLLVLTLTLPARCRVVNEVVNMSLFNSCNEIFDLLVFDKNASRLRRMVCVSFIVWVCW